MEDGVFGAAGAVYGLTFRRRADLVGYHPDVVVYEVLDSSDAPVGLFLGDFYTRPGKQGGAWMEALVAQNRLLEQLPVVVNNLNLAKPAAGQPTLLSMDEIRTLFHEFGHALHGLLSSVTYPRLAGTAVSKDFVEYPSQVNEMWGTDPSCWPAMPGTSRPAIRCRPTRSRPCRSRVAPTRRARPSASWPRPGWIWPGTG